MGRRKSRRRKENLLIPGIENPLEADLISPIDHIHEKYDDSIILDISNKCIEYINDYHRRKTEATVSRHYSRDPGAYYYPREYYTTKIKGVNLTYPESDFMI